MSDEQQQVADADDSAVRPGPKVSLPATTESDIPPGILDAVLEGTYEATKDAIAEELAGQPKAKLQGAAKALGLPVSGNREELATRITEEAAKPEHEPYFGGWYKPDVPVYACPHCAYRARSTRDVMWHLGTAHPDSTSTGDDR